MGTATIGCPPRKARRWEAEMLFLGGAAL